MKNRFQFLHFPKPKRSCSSCHKEFAQEEAIYSSISEDSGEEPIRVDLCVACFEGMKQDLRERAHWRLVKPEEKVSKKLSWKELDERALCLLDEAVQNPTSEAKQEAALLALHLLRRKKVAIDAEDQENVVYRHLETGRIFTIARSGDGLCGPSPELQQSLQRKLFSV